MCLQRPRRLRSALASCSFIPINRSTARITFLPFLISLIVAAAELQPSAAASAPAEKIASNEHMSGNNNLTARALVRFAK